MFFKLVRYKLLLNIKQKETFFWCLMFPIILGLFFKLAFAGLYEIDTKKEAIKVAIAEDSSSQSVISDAFSQSDFFKVIKTDNKKGQQLKSDGKVTAYIEVVNNKATVYVNENGMSQSIVKSVVDTIAQTSSAINHIYSINPEGVSQQVIADMSQQKSFTQMPKANSNDDQSAVYFFALIAMAVMFSMNIGLYTISYLQANRSPLGARQSICPRGKNYLFMAYYIADFITQIVSVTLLLFYIKYILKYNIGQVSFKLLLFCYAAVFASLAMGTFISASLNISENAKGGLCSAITLVSCGLSGLFFANMKYIVDKNMPFISYINPGTLISDGIFSQYYLNSNSVYLRCLLTLTVMGAVLFGVTYLVLRRQRYASI